DIRKLAGDCKWNEPKGAYLGLVSKAFLPFACLGCFRWIFLTKSSALLKFVETVEANPHVGAYVQKLQVY
ncbi:hypothetical protein JCM8547_003114, partial [Rhodosporidiobolus lusitaniae]